MRSKRGKYILKVVNKGWFKKGGGGPYVRTEKRLEASKKNIQIYNDSGKNRQPKDSERLRLAARQNILNFLDNVGGRELASRNISKYNKSEDGIKHRKVALEKATAFNQSEEGRKLHRLVGRKVGKKIGAKSLAKVMSRNPTKSQMRLSKFLSEAGISNVLEFFVPKIRRIIDIAIPRIKLAVEVDGASHFDSKFCSLFGHSLESRQLDDCLKDKQLAHLGWKVLRFTDMDIQKDIEKVVETVRKGIGE